MSIWSFNRKRYPDGRFIKHKSRLCSHGVMHKWVVNYMDTYSPVFNWLSVSSMLALSILRELHAMSVDFVLAYTQSDVKSEIFMELPIGFGVEGYHTREWFVIIYKNLYGLKDAGMAWFEKLKEDL